MFLVGQRAKKQIEVLQLCPAFLYYHSLSIVPDTLLFLRVTADCSLDSIHRKKNKMAKEIKQKSTHFPSKNQLKLKL